MKLVSLSRSLNEMTTDLYKRINVAETFSSDLAHEIRNPLDFFKGCIRSFRKYLQIVKKEKN